MSDCADRTDTCTPPDATTRDARSGAFELHILSLADALSGRFADRWDTSSCDARLTPEKVRAMRENPAVARLPKGDAEPAQLVATKGGRVVGRLDFIAGDLVVQRGMRTSMHSILWGSNLFVPPDERKSMVGPMLLMKAATLSATVGAHGPSQLAMPLYEKLRFAAIPLERHILLQRSRSVARRYLGDGMAATAASAVGDLALLGLRGINASRSIASGLRIRRVPTMPAEFAAAIRNDGPDPLLQASHPDASGDAIPTQIRGRRSIEWVNWLIANEFGSQGEASRTRHERALFLVENRRRTPLGYLLLKVKFHRRATAREFPDLTLGSLADWAVFDSRPEFRDQFRSILVAMAIRAASAASVDALEVCVAPTDSLAQRLRSFGFLRAGAMTCMVRANASSALHSLPYAKPGSWALQYGDGESVLG